ncbi:MAG: glucokinase [Gammaproteobacteria bacterium]|nr:glucokinase [Gammaproteobacteria bacterium]MCF6231160.1 glucokinase [Gammaproteobacteria bacterium]
MSTLAGDIGGTKVLLQMSHGGKTVLEQQYVSANYASFEQLLTDFMSHCQHPVAVACFGVAGPVDGHRACVTNLPWQLDSQQLQQQFSIPSVVLINDFQAVGYGISVLPDEAFETLQTGDERPQGVRALIGAGTGLGQAFMVWGGEHYQVLATEGGHVDFAPTDELQVELLQFMRLNAYRTTYEHLVSGNGLVSIFNFLCERNPELLSQKMARAMAQQGVAAVIAQFALESGDTLANQALDLFLKIYASQVGNHALNTLPYGGLYIAGGIAPKLIERIKQGGFMAAYSDKAPMAALMKKFPIKVVMEPRVGLLGAQQVALHGGTR